MATKEETEQKLKEFISVRRQMTQDQQVGASGKIISEIKSINTNDAYHKVKSRISGINHRIRFYEQFKRVAAVFFLPLLAVSSLYLLSVRDANHQPEMSVQELTSPAGVHSQITLPDGTRVWLNGESTIRYSLPFNNSTRNVVLEGEAFFDVTKNPEVPFIVTSTHATVRVLGTTFNYKAYPGEKTEVVLAEGKVCLNTNSKTAKQAEFMLSPGEHAVINENTGQVKIAKENIDKYIAWHSGRLVFDDSPLPEVVKKLERWYGIDVFVRDPQLLSSHITTTFENESLYEVFELLELASPLKIDYIPAHIDENTGEQVDSKVIISKKTF
jgi:ferric-dicitrate binding protein FerR (iron transport regulator)